MLLGLIADIHECFPNLDAAIERLRAESVDQIVLLGDIAETGKRLAAIVSRLRALPHVGVWGNHDMGLCIDPPDDFRASFGPEIMDYFGTLTGQLAIDDCLFSHAQSWMDPADWSQPWYLHPAPDDPEMCARCLGTTDRRIQFLGHYHRWMVTNAEGRLQWDGQSPMLLPRPAGYVVVVDALLGGWCATYETDSCVLTPLRIGPSFDPG